MPGSRRGTHEESASGGGDVGAELDPIEAAVRAGERDLSALGFWKVVRRLKLDPGLAARHAKQVGRIDRAVFEAAMRFRFPVWLGNAVLLFGTAAMAAAIAFGLRLIDDPSGTTVGGVLLVVAAGGLSVTLHDLAHWLVGRVAGIRFLCYFPGGPFRIQPGLKTDYATYLRASPRARATMHASGAVASKLAPFLVLAVAASAGRLGRVPWWTTGLILALGMAQIVTDLAWSTRKSDWKKVRRELAIARELGR